MRTSVDTERLTLRRASENDLDVYCERIYGDPDVMRMLPGRAPLPMPVQVLYALESGAWGMGYATEAARAAFRAGFEDLRLDRLIAGADGENAASIGVLKKLGMKPWEQRDFHGLRLAMFTLHRAEWNA